MKVFISWSGKQSKQLGEILRDWLPGVLQAVKPYFTPSDIEKGTRWANEIAKELEASQIGILCITRENFHSDWVLFEAGALSKSLEKAYVCPILFGLTDTDFSGPLKQFQATEFNKSDFHKLLNVINTRLEDHKLPQKTVDAVFEKWWPDLEGKVKEILESQEDANEPIRTDRDILEEILRNSRSTVTHSNRPSRISPKAVKELIAGYCDLHDEQAANVGSYQETLDSMQKFQRSISHIGLRYSGVSDEIDEMLKRLKDLGFKAADESSDDDTLDEEPPF